MKAKKGKNKGTLNHSSFSSAVKSLPKGGSDSTVDFSLEKKGLVRGGSGVNKPEGFEFGK